MALYFNKKLSLSLKKIKVKEHQEFVIHPVSIAADESIFETYGKAKWALVDFLNKQHNTNFDLHNWLNYNKEDEISYFINEVGSNSLNYSQFKAPYKFHIWSGENGFIIGVEQKGEGFNAERINRLRLKENKGAAFNFFRECQSPIFFDNSTKAKIVYLEHVQN